MSNKHQKTHNKRLRILLLLDSSFPYRGGGRETGIFHIAKHGSEWFEMRAITMSPPKNSKEIFFPEAYNYFNFYHTFSMQTLLQFRGYNKIANFLDNIFFPAQAKLKVQFICKKWRPDAVVCVHAGPLGLAAMDIAKRFQCLSVLNMRSIYSEEVRLTSILHKPFWRLFKRVEHKVINEIDLILANGEDTYEICKEKHGRKKPIEIVHNGVNTNLFRPSTQISLRKKLGLENHIVFISNNPMRFIKGPHHALSAIARMPEPVKSSSRILFFGKGPSSLQFQKHAKQLGIDDLVVWLPQVKHQEVSYYLSTADIAIHPVLFSAGTTHASLETLACGLPQISYNSASLRSTCVNGETGILVQKGDIDGLSKAMTMLATNKCLRKKMSLSARKLSLKFDWSKYVKNYAEFIKYYSR